ncbi:MAG: hypothetical protein D6784_18350 [Chloroflexi bacterium]|nr:MAG: hypothetical protein D6784_18350 [Chloroflexota bacterium]
MLRIYVRDRLGTGVPGVEIEISWAKGQERIFTGFKPDIDPGYADFRLTPNETYRVRLVGVNTSPPDPEIRIEPDKICPALPKDVDPSWQIVFQQGITR